MLQLPGLMLLKNSTAACLSLHKEKKQTLNKKRSGLFCGASQTKVGGNPKGISSSETGSVCG